MQLQGKRILVGITGSIAAYKTISLVRLLTKQGAEVKVVMTPSAANFASPLVLQTLSNNAVLADLADGSEWSNHVMLGRWADLFIIAPCSCNTLAKMYAGICDNLLMAVYLSATCPVAIAPAMDEDMWHHETTKRNIQFLINSGKLVIPVDSGSLASGLVGEGRMAEPEAITHWITELFTPKYALIADKQVLITAGPTFEAIDPVRFIGNHSSGLMGIELAKSFIKNGANVTLIVGPIHLETPVEAQVVRVNSADEMFAASKLHLPQCQIVVMAAAVADYRPAEQALNKIKKQADSLVLQLVKNPDILQYAGHNKTDNQFIVGFALETNDELANAYKKLEHKKADMIVLNSLKDEHAGFGSNTNKVTIISAKGSVQELPLDTKAVVADNIVAAIAKELANK